MTQPIIPTGLALDEALALAMGWTKHPICVHVDGEAERHTGGEPGNGVGFYWTPPEADRARLGSKVSRPLPWSTSWAHAGELMDSLVARGWVFNIKNEPNRGWVEVYTPMALDCHWRSGKTVPDAVVRAVVAAFERGA